ncbi:aspartate carbamoyltransferase [Paraferrimonas sedimenticola]|uniref:Aspartate carbamoyltransferase n=1 Tax=Paraferrimonas sedimenticola TaxID=375674 RepID=A0AA37RZK4_9GAMM|nr:aspartate carbamoyltransferase [Paraferrimonas sedimenticola]GLP98131.1 aspartate carbamoyltransferase [Paraferrimonas sedimenticola]
MTNTLFQKDIISISDLSRQELELIVSRAQSIKQQPQPNLLAGKVVASCFFEASTRTRLSFETAVQRLGGSVIGFADGANTSLGQKGETLADSVSVISSYSDAFFMRHPKEGAARLASEYSKVPVINGGDGSNQHPTQTLLDLFTIFETQGTLDGLKLAFVGDLKYGRTVHSLAQAMAHFDCQFYFVAPEALTMPDYILRELSERSVNFTLVDDLDSIVSELDILYVTRVQRERFDETEYQYLKSKYVITNDTLKDAKANLKVLHPLPRVDEIDVEVDATPHAYYFQQAENGVYARQALLSLVLREELEL